MALTILPGSNNSWLSRPANDSFNLTVSEVRSLEDCFLYGILDLSYVARTQLEQVAIELIEGGIDMLQLRAKDHSQAEVREMAERVLPHTRLASVPFVINDHPEVARLVGADGVHVGQDDPSVAEARSLAGERCLVGKSTHSLDQAVAAEREGADYIGFGPLFATATKPDYEPIGVHDIARARELVRLPMFCIGGINRENLTTVIDRGARRVVMVSGILLADDRRAYIDECRKMIAKAQS